MRIVGIGNLVTDLYYLDEKLIGVCGGKTTSNIIFNLSYRGYKTSIIGMCGNDIYGKIAIDSLKQVRVDVSNIFIQEISTKKIYNIMEKKKDKYSFHYELQCPKCGNKNAQYKSLDYNVIKDNIKSDDIIVIDDLNKTNLEIVKNLNNKIMLDLGYYYQFLYKSKEEIIKKLNNKFEIINMNNKVANYLLKRFRINNYTKLYKLINTKLLIITKGDIGADFIFNNQVITKLLIDKAEEVDPSGAGDAFFSVIISEYIDNNFILNKKIIDKAFNKATTLTKKVVSKIGARSHIIDLYKIKSKPNTCDCGNKKP